jgi:hypothetical protein
VVIFPKLNINRNRFVESNEKIGDSLFSHIALSYIQYLDG